MSYVFTTRPAPVATWAERADDLCRFLDVVERHRKFFVEIRDNEVARRCVDDWFRNVFGGGGAGAYMGTETVLAMCVLLNSREQVMQERDRLTEELQDMRADYRAAIARADAAERTLREWEADYGALIRQSRQHITTEDADVPVRAADRDDVTLTMPLTDGGKDGAR